MARVVRRPEHKRARVAQRMLRCSFCGFPRHATRRGVIRCIGRALRLARELALDAGASRVEDSDGVVYPYRGAVTVEAPSVNLSDTCTTL